MLAYSQVRSESQSCNEGGFRGDHITIGLTACSDGIESLADFHQILEFTDSEVRIIPEVSFSEEDSLSSFSYSESASGILFKSR